MEQQDLLDNFPFGEPRPMQRWVLREIANAVKGGKKFIILEGPTGFGKSPVAVAVARTMGSSFLCTTTKVLQDQYQKDFPYIRKVIGSKNFSCSQLHDENDKPATCSAGAAVKCDDRTYDKEDDMDLPDCPYVRQKLEALRASHTLLNYHYFLSLLKYTQDVKPNDKQLLICDEAHELPNIIKDFHSMTLSQYWLRQILPGQTIPKLQTTEIQPWITLFKNLLGAMRQVEQANQSVMNSIQKIVVAHGGGQSVDNTGLEKTINEFALQLTAENGLYINANEINEGVVEKLRESLGDIKRGDVLLGATKITKRLLLITELATRLQFFLDVVEKSPNTWVIDAVPDSEDPENKAHKIQMLPINVDRYAREMFSNTEYVLLMSATILDVRTFARTLGLDESEYAFIQAPSSFSPQNRPVYFKDIGAMNYNLLPGLLPAIVRDVEKVLDMYPDKKGIIHTHTKAIMNYICDNISERHKSRLLKATADAMHDEPSTEEDTTEERITNYQQRILKKHADSKNPTVLVSPSLHTGVDLAGDLSRFQIVVKTPYPSLADNWVKRKQEVDPQWYKWQVALRLIQMCGRSVRSETDWAHTYMLDSLTHKFVISNQRLFPLWFKEGFKN